MYINVKVGRGQERSKSCENSFWMTLVAYIYSYFPSKGKYIPNALFLDLNLGLGDHVYVCSSVSTLWKSK